VSPDLEAIHDERLASYCDDNGDKSPLYAVGDRVGRDGRVVLAVDHDAVLLSEVGGDSDGAIWIDAYALARRS